MGNRYKALGAARAWLPWFMGFLLPTRHLGLLYSNIRANNSGVFWPAVRGEKPNFWNRP
jgi:hypothetical protein